MIRKSARLMKIRVDNVSMMLNLLVLPKVSVFRKLIYYWQLRMFNPSHRLILSMYYASRYPVSWIVASALRWGIRFTFIYAIYIVYKNSKVMVKSFTVSSKTGARLKDLKGIDEYLDELNGILDFLKRPKSYVSNGGRPPRGILLTGPPGCGKTHIARALADESDRVFYYASASDFATPDMGKGPELIRTLFKDARKNRKGSIIFIDELDSIGTRTLYANAPNDVVNTLLAEMDGFENNQQVFVIGSTNREHAIDDALKRPGRFDLKITIDLPYREGRKQIFDFYLSKISHGEVDSEKLAEQSFGLSGAHLKNIVNLSIIKAVQTGKDKASQEDLEAALEKTKIGYRSLEPLSKDQRKKAAYREASKLVMGITQPYMPRIEKTVIAAIGDQRIGDTMVFSRPSETSINKREVLANVLFYLAPLAIEELIFGANEQSMYAAVDKEKAHDYLDKYVSKYSMDDGFSYVSGESSDFSWKLADKVEWRTNQLLLQSYSKVKDILASNVDLVRKVAAELEDKEVLYFKDAKALIG